MFDFAHFWGDFLYKQWRASSCDLTVTAGVALSTINALTNGHKNMLED